MSLFGRVDMKMGQSFRNLKKNMKDKETDGIIQYNNELFIFHGTVKKR